MKTTRLMLGALTVSLAATAAAASDETRLEAVASMAPKVEWACERAGAPSFAEIERLGIRGDARQYRARLQLVNLIRRTCNAASDGTTLVLERAGSEDTASFAAR